MAEEQPTYSDEFKHKAVTAALGDMSPFPQIEDSLGIRRGLLMQWMLEIKLDEISPNPEFEELREMRLEIESIRLESEMLSTIAEIKAQNQPPQTGD